MKRVPPNTRMSMCVAYLKVRLGAEGLGTIAAARGQGRGVGVPDDPTVELLDTEQRYESSYATHTISVAKTKFSARRIASVSDSVILGRPFMFA